MIVSKNYPVGNSNGQYPAGNKIVDTLLGYADVSGIIVSGQSYNTGITHDKANCTLDFGNVYTSQNGDVITVLFANGIKLENEAYF